RQRELAPPCTCNAAQRQTGIPQHEQGQAYVLHRMRNYRGRCHPLAGLAHILVPVEALTSKRQEKLARLKSAGVGIDFMLAPPRQSEATPFAVVEQAAAAPDFLIGLMALAGKKDNIVRSSPPD